MPLPSIQQSTNIERYHSVRSVSEKICQPLQTEDYVAQPVMDVSPPKWHLAHTTWFFETFLLVPGKPGYSVYDSTYAYLFNSYYIGAGDRWVRADRGDITRPGVQEIYEYRAYVDEAMKEFLENGLSEGQYEVFQIGLNHEQQHQELLLYDIKYILGVNPIYPVYKALETELSLQMKAEWLKVEEGVHSVGYEGKEFHFDNEEGMHRVFLESYEIRSNLVTCGEYLEFIQDGGYEIPQLWLSEGWDWVQSQREHAPLYWHRLDEGWKTFTLAGLRDLDPHEAVSHVSFFEADAFARWKGVRLPTEFEWEVACQQFEPSIPDDAVFHDADRIHVSGQKSGYQFYGNLWEWTSSAYRPYPYYKVPEGTIGEYNGKFMINQMVLRGGSYATSRDHIRPTYRNFFHPHLRWMFSGIRLARHF